MGGRSWWNRLMPMMPATLTELWISLFLFAALAGVLVGVIAVQLA
jgi:ABC-type antimicrobial peptide transport system permease subunit